MILADLATPSLPGIITAVAAVITALSLLVASFAVFLPVLRATRKNTTAIQEVHTIVNQQRTDMQNYQRALITALTAAGVDIPDDQSQPPS